jgi:hypothetical protein
VLPAEGSALRGRARLEAAGGERADDGLALAGGCVHGRKHGAVRDRVARVREEVRRGLRPAAAGSLSTASAFASGNA